MKLQASCTPFEMLPPKVWENVRRAIIASCADWGIPIEVEETLSIREAEARFRDWQNRGG